MIVVIIFVTVIISYDCYTIFIITSPSGSIVNSRAVGLWADGNTEQWYQQRLPAHMSKHMPKCMPKQISEHMPELAVVLTPSA